jgi:GTP pyrophosphokinase
MIQFARCCQPIYGDGVLGVITRGKGISVHRRDCRNIANLTEGRDRLVDVDWNSEEQTVFTVQIHVNGVDRPNFLRDVSQVVSGLGIPVVEGRLNTAGGRVGNRFTVEVRNVDQLRDLRKKILSVPGVSSVQRVNGSSNNVL